MLEYDVVCTEPGKKELAGVTTHGKYVGFEKLQ